MKPFSSPIGQWAYTGLLISLTGLFLFTCDPPMDPYDVREAKVGVLLKSSSGITSGSSITDTVGNTDTIGAIIYLTQHFDSTEIEVFNGDARDYYFVYKKKARVIDTVWYPVSFSTPGMRTVTVTGYVKDMLNREAKATIQVVARPQPNRRPDSACP